MLVMLANKHTRNVCLLSAPSNHMARGVPAQDALARTPLCPVPSGIDLSTPPPRPPSNGHFTPWPEQSDYPANEGWCWREDIGAWADLHHVLSPMGFKHQKQNPLNPPQQDSPVPSFPCKQTPRKPTPGPSDTRWLEELFREPSPTEEPPIPGPSL
ncbi:hypothetical protein O181_072580 [Austropuccinia psidii MF-1]|uniref:Uncharacterized protein n=1 Tax=Austropuccinia psidii MF-1 TaxID=1389203 RepID=A0A9Q3F8Y0_9BASI|nr:hypothetical protein [Austropuccinia psidii MF-1]